MITRVALFPIAWPDNTTWVGALNEAGIRCPNLLEAEMDAVSRQGRSFPGPRDSVNESPGRDRTDFQCCLSIAGQERDSRRTKFRFEPSRSFMQYNISRFW